MLASRVASKTASIAIPNARGGEARTFQNYRTEVSTYFTQPSSEQQLMYSAENWVRFKVTLETAGPVAIGTSEQIAPVLSGKGRLLDTGTEYEIYLARGSRIYVASESVNRLSVTIEPIPWMEQLSGEIVNVAQTVASTFQRVGDAIVAALTGAAAPPPSPPAMSNQISPPVLPRKMAPRLTPVGPARKGR